MSEFTWYSRLAAWAGALVLLVQSITGRSTGVMTLLGLLLLAGGFAAFLSGLVMDATPTSEVPADGSTGIALDESAVPAPESLEAEASQPQVAPETVTEAGDLVDAPVPVAADVLAAPVEDVPVELAAVATQEVMTESPLCGVACARCRQDIVEGQMAAACPMCGSGHHAACWIDNRFHCSMPGCTGHGNLVAPDESSRSAHS